MTFKQNKQNPDNTSFKRNKPKPIYNVQAEQNLKKARSQDFTLNEPDTNYHGFQAEETKTIPSMACKQSKLKQQWPTCDILQVLFLMIYLRCNG